MLPISSPAPLPDYIQQTIQELQKRIDGFERDILKCKEMINSLLTLNGQQPRYADVAAKESASHGAIRRDQFFGQPLSTVVKEILTRRRAANQGPASVNDIYKSMLDGGYQFDAKDDDNAKRGLRISLTKNSALFIKLPHGDYGLRAWYPAAKEPRQVTNPTVRPSRFQPPAAAESDGTSDNSEAKEPEIKNGEVDEFDFAAKQAEETEEVADFLKPSKLNEEDIPF